MVFGSAAKGIGHKPMPSPEKRLDDADLPKDYPMPNSLFPQYSASVPGFGTPATVVVDANEEETVDFLASDGTPVFAMVSPKNHAKGLTSPEGDKQIPLHVQTDDTIPEDEEIVQHPSEFPCLSPPTKRLMIPVFQQPGKHKASDNETGSQWTRYRLWALILVVLGLLISIIVIIASVTGGEGGEPNVINSEEMEFQEVKTPAPTVALFGGGEGDIVVGMLPPMIPTTPTPTVEPTAAPFIVYPTVPPSTGAPSIVTIPPTEAPTTRAPTLNRNHPLVGTLRFVSPLEQLVNPYTPQGEALIWLATTDKQVPKNEQRLFQRYAMVVLDVALHTPQPRFWSSRNLHECRWPGVTCNDERHVTGINWARESLPGTIPAELGLLTHLTSLDLAQNQLKGNLEPLYNLHKLEHAYVFENSLTGTISKDLENCRNMTRFFAGHNQLSGSIPQNMKKRPLEWFVVHFNQLTGTIPETLRFDLTVVFDVSYNQLSGTIPENFATEIVPNVRHVHMDHNQLSGSIPGSFRELGKGRLRQLFLNDNNLGGLFPADWYTVKFLNNIDISNNKFRNDLNDMCLMSVFEYGELVEMRADCPICNCDRLCRTCRDNKDYTYEYDDDDWTFDDDED